MDGDASATSPSSPPASAAPPPTAGPSSASGGATQDESTLRKAILAIQRDASIPDSDKARRIQQLMTGQVAAKHLRAAGVPSQGVGAPGPSSGGAGHVHGPGCSHGHGHGHHGSGGGAAPPPGTTVINGKVVPIFNEPGAIRDEERSAMYHDEDNKVYGCKHYMRSVKLQSHCCGKWVVCRFCHDEVSDHAIIRQKTKLMMCMKCYHIQPCSQFCSNPACAVKVSRYYCNECKLWDDDPKKNIYHCYDCGICRIGRGLGQDYFHCKKCNVCMAIGLKDRHKCIERNLESDCPICGEYMFTSTTTVIFMPCGHCIHHKCYQEHIQTSYTCPTCCKSLGNMTEYFLRIEAALRQHQMPPEYANHRTLVFCNDCESRSVSPYHFLYHKCSGTTEATEQSINQTTGLPEERTVTKVCGSFNTRVLQTFVEGTPEAEAIRMQLEAVTRAQQEERAAAKAAAAAATAAAAAAVATVAAAGTAQPADEDDDDDDDQAMDTE